MICQQDALGATGNILFRDPFHMMPQENHRYPSPVTGKSPRLPQHLQGQTILRMIAVISKDPDL